MPGDPVAHASGLEIGYSLLAVGYWKCRRPVTEQRELVPVLPCEGVILRDARWHIRAKAYYSLTVGAIV